MTTATPEQINRALAAWLGWQNDARYWPRWHDGNLYTKYSTLPHSPDYFNPCQRIDHAWLLVERMQTLGWWYTVSNERWNGQHFCEFRRADEHGVHHFRYKIAETAARAICEAVIEIAEIAV